MDERDETLSATWPIVEREIRASMSKHPELRDAHVESIAHLLGPNRLYEETRFVVRISGDGWRDDSSIRCDTHAKLVDDVRSVVTDAAALARRTLAAKPKCPVCAAMPGWVCSSCRSPQVCHDLPPPEHAGRDRIMIVSTPLPHDIRRQLSAMLHDAAEVRRGDSPRSWRPSATEYRTRESATPSMPMPTVAPDTCTRHGATVADHARSTITMADSIKAAALSAPGVRGCTVCSGQHPYSLDVDVSGEDFDVRHLGYAIDEVVPAGWLWRALYAGKPARSEQWRPSIGERVVLTRPAEGFGPHASPLAEQMVGGKYEITRKIGDRFAAINTGIGVDGTAGLFLGKRRASAVGLEMFWSMDDMRPD